MDSDLERGEVDVERCNAVLAALESAIENLRALSDEIERIKAAGAVRRVNRELKGQAGNE